MYEVFVCCAGRSVERFFEAQLYAGHRKKRVVYCVGRWTYVGLNLFLVQSSPANKRGRRCRSMNRNYSTREGMAEVFSQPKRKAKITVVGRRENKDPVM